MFLSKMLSLFLYIDIRIDVRVCVSIEIGIYIHTQIYVYVHLSGRHVCLLSGMGRKSANAVSKPRQAARQRTEELTVKTPLHVAVWKSKKDVYAGQDKKMKRSGPIVQGSHFSERRLRRRRRMKGDSEEEEQREQTAARRMEMRRRRKRKLEREDKRVKRKSSENGTKDKRRATVCVSKE